VSSERNFETKSPAIFGPWDERLTEIKAAADGRSARQVLRYAEALIKRNLFSMKDLWDEYAQ
jgi:hypothetical protein